MPQPELGQRLRAARTNAGVSLAELARRSGLTRAAIRNIESGSSDPSTQTVQQLAKSLSISAAWLAFDVDGAVATDSTDKDAR